MVILDLSEVYNMTNKNEYVLHLANKGTVKDPENIDIYAICGTSDGGILIEESLEMFFEQSFIKMQHYDSYVALIQGNSEYHCDIVMNSAACYGVDQHLDFNTLRKVQ